jgi:hypothetical protein
MVRGLADALVGVEFADAELVNWESLEKAGRARDSEVEREVVLDVKDGGDNRPRVEVSLCSGQLSMDGD